MLHSSLREGESNGSGGGGNAYSLAVEDESSGSLKYRGGSGSGFLPDWICFRSMEARYLTQLAVNIVVLIAVVVFVLVYATTSAKSSGASGDGAVATTACAMCTGTSGPNNLNANVPGNKTAQPYAPLVSFEGNPTVTPDAMPCNLTIGYVADTYLNADTQNAYSLLISEGVELTVISGDLDYTERSWGPALWEQQIDQFLGTSHPIIVAAGNHDNYFWDIYGQRIAARMTRTGLSTCSGLIGIMQTCTYKGLTIVTTSPGVFNSTEQSRNFSRIVNANGPAKFEVYIDNALNTYRSPWRICSWHKNQHSMQTGTKEDDTGWPVYQTCLAHGATIMTGHEHTYSRTYLMKSLGAGMQGTPQGNTMAMDSEGRPISSPLTLTANQGETNPTSFVVVQGLGGNSVREAQNPNVYWAATQNLYNGAAPAAVTICKYNFNGNPLRAYCYTKDIWMRIVDEWYINVSPRT